MIMMKTKQPNFEEFGDQVMISYTPLELTPEQASRFLALLKNDAVLYEETEDYKRRAALITELDEGIWQAQMALRGWV